MDPLLYVDEFTGLHLLQADAFSVTVAGGTVNLSLDAGATQAGRSYLMLGTKTGTAPGLPLPGCVGSFRAGRRPVKHPLIGPGHIGSLLQFAYLLEGSPDRDFVSNPLGIEITP